MTESSCNSSAPRPAIFITALVVALFLIRLTGPSDLIDYGQEAPTSYVLDAVENGHWLVQWDVKGNITSKPPLYTWLAAAVSTIAGAVTRWTLCLPAGLATWALALLIFTAGKKYFGARAGLLAAMIYVLSPVAAKQVALVRTDGLFSLTVALTAWLAYRAWEKGKGWELCWLAAAAAALTKGPLGLVLAAGGLLAAWWERRTGNPAPIKGRHWPGLLLFFFIGLGWFALAYWDVGRALTDRMLVRELYGRAVSKGEGSTMGVGFYLPTLYFLSRFAPWSLISAVAMWRVVKRPTPDPAQRRWERFLFCWFAVGLVIFSLAAHQRADLIFPLVPPAALLAGREIARWLTGWSKRKFTAVAAALSLTGLFAFGFEYHVSRPRNESVVMTFRAEQLAGAVREQVGDGFPLVHVDTSPVLQLHLGTVNPLVTPERATRLLQGGAAAFVAVKNLEASQLSTNSLHVLAEAPRTKRTHMAIVGNRPVLAWTGPLATVIGPLRLEMSGVRKFRRRAYEFWLENESPSAYLELTNESDAAISARVHFTGGGTALSEAVVVPAGETRKVICQ